MIRKTDPIVFIVMMLFVCPSLRAESTDQCLGGGAQLSQQENNRHLAANSELSKEENDIQGQYQKEVLSCQQKYSGTNDVKALEACTAEAAKRERIALLEVGKKRADEDKIHNDQMNEITFYCSSKPEKNLDACQDQADAENYRHQEGILSLQLERNQIQDDYQKDILNCQEQEVNGASSDQFHACTNAASQQEQASLLEVEKKQTDLDTAHKNQMADIQTSCDQKIYNCSKGLYKAPGINSVPAAPKIDLNSLVDSMNSCLQNKMRYYSAPSLKTYQGTVNYANGTVSYDPSYLSQQSAYNQVFLVAGALSQRVLDLREQVYSVKKSPEDLALEKATLIGFLTRCAYDKGFVKGDPRADFSNFIKSSGEPSGQGECEFFAHFNMPLLPFTIAMD